MSDATASLHRRQGEILLAALGLDAKALAVNLDDIAPGFANFIVEAAFGSILSRPGLDLRTREIATVGMLTALGAAPEQLKIHIGCALNAGGTRSEIVEVIVQTCLYAGIPAALNGLVIARDAFAQRKSS